MRSWVVKTETAENTKQGPKWLLREIKEVTIHKSKGTNNTVIDDIKWSAFWRGLNAAVKWAWK